MKFIKIETIKRLCWVFTGLFITMPYFSLGGINLYNWALILYLIIVISQGKLFYRKEAISLYILFVLLIISSLLSTTIVPFEWSVVSLSTVVKSAVVMMAILFFSSEKDISVARNELLKGLFYAAIAHLIWMSFQYVAYHTGGVDLNYLVFGKQSPRQNGAIALTGLTWERASTICALLFGGIYTDKAIFKLLFVIGIFMTSSRTGIIMLSVVILYDIVAYLSKREYHVNFNISFPALVITLVTIVLLIVILQNDAVQKNIDYTIIRFQRVFTGGDDYTSTAVDGHILYYQWFWPALKMIPTRELLFGCGTNISGWVYATYFGRFPELAPWSIETDFLAIIFGNGIIGAIAYYYNFIKLFVKQKNTKLKKIILSIFVGTFFYGFLASSLSLIIMVLCVSFNSDPALEKRTFETQL